MQKALTVYVHVTFFQIRILECADTLPWPQYRELCESYERRTHAEQDGKRLLHSNSEAEEELAEMPHSHDPSYVMTLDNFSADNAYADQPLPPLNLHQDSTNTSADFTYAFFREHIKPTGLPAELRELGQLRYPRHFDVPTTSSTVPPPVWLVFSVKSASFKGLAIAAKLPEMASSIATRTCGGSALDISSRLRTSTRHDSTHTSSNYAAGAVRGRVGPRSLLLPTCRRRRAFRE